MSEQFSTDLVPVSDRLDAWYHNAREICGDCRFFFPKPYPFHGSISRRRVAAIDLTQFSSSPLAFAKFPMVAANAADRGCVVITQLEGSRSYSQLGAMTLLNPGDTTLIDPGSPWSSECRGRCTRLYMRFPRWMVQNRLRLRSLPLLPRISGESGLGATLFRLATSLYDEAGVLTLDEGAAAVEAYLGILSGCIGSFDSAREIDHREETWARIRKAIESRLGDPSLTPRDIAAALGISTRHLHRLFSGADLTVAEWVRCRRLQRCRADLANPRLRDRTITEIALFWGFSDSSHFSRCFKSEFGVSARAFRKRLVGNPESGHLRARVPNALASGRGRYI